MTDSIRCPACRGSKKVPKLGGMIGECNTCSGKGTILAVDKPSKVDAVTLEDVISKELINAVAQAVPVSDSLVRAALLEGLADGIKTQPEMQMRIEEPQVKVDGKKAVFRHKTSAK